MTTTLSSTGDRPVAPTKRPRGRPRGSGSSGRKPAPYITINEHRVTWSMIKYTYKRLGCDWDATIDAFWKARKATGSNGIYRYIMAGFKPSARGVAYNNLPSKERENGQMESVRQWWLRLYVPTGTRDKTISTYAPEVKSMLESLTEAFSL